ncbi:transcriptional regulator [Bacillus shivajii]|uniref:transcriptional regulator SplA domain-containing protein n=1 Tax=Bacillus shivajii TaxID=1983719 RepID=UPI001CFA4966|nr:transcriptional regulator SplA domain-containing protein [Bacillus shivajii]UCZ54249.1 transcriptional regulator [Bacillus shivajii]
MNLNDLQKGDTVYVISRNPHTQTVAQIQEAEIVDNPDHPEKLSLFLFEEHFPLTEEYAIYSSFEEAEQMYHHYFQINENETL